MPPVRTVHASAGDNELWEQTAQIEHEILAVVYLVDTYPLRETASGDSKEVLQLKSGQTVYIQGVTVDEKNEIWVQVATYSGMRSYSGYVPRRYLACSDEDFLQWESQYLRKGRRYLTSEGEAVYEDVACFPESYRGALYELKKAHPQWVFVRMDVGLDWNTVLQNEMKGSRSLIYKTYPAYMRGECYDGKNWYYATENALAYFLDPRNGLTADSIFQFELLTYNETYHTVTAVEAYLANTFMNSKNYAPATELTFTTIFTAIGAELNVSPFHLASRVCQEQGTGTSPLISGTYPGYEGFYNYFNVGASGSSNEEVIVNGLEYAKKKEWNSAYTSIYGGASVIASSYIQKGQDTIYLEKFNVNPEGYYKLYTHQYMQNISAPTTEGKKVKEMYEGAGSLDNTFVFKIPVYENMPANACPMPQDADKVWKDEDGGRYWYENGVRQGTEGRGKEIYDPGSNAWYWLDAEFGGRMAVDKDVYMEDSYAGEYADHPDGTGKWVRYDTEGHMVKGEDYRNGGWYRFDLDTGAMVKGWFTAEDGKRYYYDKDNGQRVYGIRTVDDTEYYFEEETGALADCVWMEKDGLRYWYENGVRQGTADDPQAVAIDGTVRGREVLDPNILDANGNGTWFWLDADNNGAMARSKDVYQLSLAGEWGDRTNDAGEKIGKWVRYDAEGRMIKGWCAGKDDKAEGITSADQANGRSVYYFDPVFGTMAKGDVVIDGQSYYFDTVTGILQQ